MQVVQDSMDEKPGMVIAFTVVVYLLIALVVIYFFTVKQRLRNQMKDQQEVYALQ